MVSSRYGVRGRGISSGALLGLIAAGERRERAEVSPERVAFRARVRRVQLEGRVAGVVAVGRGVVTPDGRGVVCGVERPGWGSTGPAVVIVGFGFPVVEERQRGRKVERVTFLFEVERRYPVGDVELVPAAAQRESVEEFMARKRDPSWRPAALPRSRRLPRLPEAKFEALMREHGADRVS